MRVYIMLGILALCILIVAFCGLIFLPGMNQSIFNATNALDQGWPPFLQFVMFGWWYIVIGIIVAASIVIFMRLKGGRGPV